MLPRQTTLTRWARALATLLITLALLACASFKEASEDARKSEAAVKTELGVDAQVSFRVFSGASGKKTYVTVLLKRAPPGDVSALKARVTDIVSRNFRSHVDNVEVRF